MGEQGFIKLSRRFFKNPLWKEPRQLSRAEAWLDLICSARFEASKEILNNRVIEVRRGEIIASRRFLEQRWNWGSSKVTNFLEFLKNEGMINQRQTSGQTIITLCNYDSYNDSPTSELQENKPATNQRQTSNKPATNQNKEREERKEGKENIISPLSPDGDIPQQGEVCPDHSKILEEKKEKSSAKKERKVFVPPSAEEVTQYCKENGYTINPNKFVNYYTSNGWMVGRNKMKDWKAAVRIWQSKENNYGERQIPASNQLNAGKPVGNSSGNDAANKRTELDNLENLAEAILRSTGAPNG